MAHKQTHKQTHFVNTQPRYTHIHNQNKLNRHTRPTNQTNTQTHNHNRFSNFYNQTNKHAQGCKQTNNQPNKQYLCHTNKHCCVNQTNTYVVVVSMETMHTHKRNKQTNKQTSFCKQTNFSNNTNLCVSDQTHTMTNSANKQTRPVCFKQTHKQPNKQTGNKQTNMSHLFCVLDKQEANECVFNKR